MKKLFFAILILSSVPAHAISIKEKIKNLRKSLAIHAESENKSWNLLEDIDKRVLRLERGSVPCPRIVEEKIELIETPIIIPDKFANESEKMQNFEDPSIEMPRKREAHCKFCTSGFFSSRMEPGNENQNLNEVKKPKKRSRIPNV